MAIGHEGIVGGDGAVAAFADVVIGHDVHFTFVVERCKGGSSEIAMVLHFTHWTR